MVYSWDPLAEASAGEGALQPGSLIPRKSELLLPDSFGSAVRPRVAFRSVATFHSKAMRGRIALLKRSARERSEPHVSSPLTEVLRLR
jgi:hypothetical protein